MGQGWGLIARWVCKIRGNPFQIEEGKSKGWGRDGWPSVHGRGKMSVGDGKDGV